MKNYLRSWKSFLVGKRGRPRKIVKSTIKNVELFSVSSVQGCSVYAIERGTHDLDERFMIFMAENIEMKDDDDPKSYRAAQASKDWSKWKAATIEEINTMVARGVFGPTEEANAIKTIIGSRWVFVRKRNEKGFVTRFKARLVARGFMQKPGVDYMSTYSPVMDAITYRALIGIVLQYYLKMKLMDVVTAYLYGDMHEELFMDLPDGYPRPPGLKRPVLKILKSLYGLKQSGRNWYERLRIFLLEKGYRTDPICPCVFIKREQGELSIIAVYVDDLNIIGTDTALETVASFLSKEFEMKDLGPTKFCIGLQIDRITRPSEHGILVHQTTYTQKILRRFNMHECHPVRTPLPVRRLDPEHDMFGPRREGEDVLSPETPYLAAIGALLYLANMTRPDISFAVSLLARHCNQPTMRHWTGVKTVVRYLKGTVDYGLFYAQKGDAPEAVGLPSTFVQNESTTKVHDTRADEPRASASVLPSDVHGLEGLRISQEVESTVEVKGIKPYVRGVTNAPSARADKQRSFTNPLKGNRTTGELVGYADAGYHSDLSRGRSQTGYCFLFMNAVISWRSVLQTLIATSSNHAEIIALHEASRECVWLRSLMNKIYELAGLPTIDAPTVIYEDNTACITQMKEGSSKVIERSILRQSSFIRVNSLERKSSLSK